MTADDIVHASALPAEPDMFGFPAPSVGATSNDVVIEIDGRLLSPAVVANKLVDHGTHVRPVLCLDIAPVGSNPLHQRMHIEQVYPESRRKEAEALAATLKRGKRITFRTTMVGRRITFPHVQSVVLNPQP